MLTIKTASADLKELDEIRRLYNSSFPDDERIPWHRLFHQLDESHIMNIFYEADTPVGMSYLFLHENLVYLGYLAVEEKLRSRGYGTAILHMIQEIWKNHKIVIDIEVIDPSADNYEERVSRKQFYLHNGFEETRTGYYFYHVDYELLSCSGIVNADEFRSLILKHWGPIAQNAVFKNLKETL